MDALVPATGTAFASQNTSYTGAAGTLTGWQPAPAVVVWCTTDAYIAVGLAGSTTATTADTPIPAYTPVPFVVPQTGSKNWTVSAIQITAGGSVFAKPLASL